MKKNKDKVLLKKLMGFNVKIQSQNNRNTAEYYRIIKSIFDNDITENVGSEKAMAFNSQNYTELTIDKIKYQVIFGELVRYTILDNENWYNKPKKTFESFDTPKDIYPNGYRTNYYFIPAIHKFYIEKNSKVSSISTKLFLEKSLSRTKNEIDNVTVDILQSSDTFEEIFNSRTISKLKIDVSYTNDDIGTEAQEVIDNLLKDAKIGYTHIELNPDSSNSLNSDSTLVKGLLDLAQENGSVIANVVNQEGKTKIIKTEQHPENIEVQFTEKQNFISVFLQKILQK